MYDTLLVIFLNEAAFIQDFLGFVSAYLATVFARCAIVSILLTIIVLFLRSTVLKRKVFLKGAIWSLFILVPFFGRLKIYFEGMKQSWRICLPFYMCQEISITYPLVRAVFFAVIFLLLFRRYVISVRMKRMLRDTKETVLCGEKVYITHMAVSPCAVGLLKPRIIIPELMIEKLPEEQLKTIILHEKTHIRLGHLWIFCAWEIFASLLWINPFLMIIEKKLRSDMEQICDRVTIQHSGKDPEEYGNLILKSSIWFRSNTPGFSATFTDDRVFRDMKLRFERIRDYCPYDRRKLATEAAILSVALITAFLFIRSASHPKYEVLPDVVVGDGYGRTYADYNDVIDSGAFIRTDDGIFIDAEKLRRILPDAFPRDRYVYFYYDIVMKIPGIGGGGECGWLEDVPESGLCPLIVSERDFKSSLALWVMKVI